MPSIGESAIRGLTEGFIGGTQLGLQLNEQQAKIKARQEEARTKTVAEARQKFEDARKQAKFDQEIVADQNLPEASRLASSNNLINFQNTFINDESNQIPPLTIMPQFGAEYAKKLGAIDKAFDKGVVTANGASKMITELNLEFQNQFKASGDQTRADIKETDIQRQTVQATALGRLDPRKAGITQEEITSAQDVAASRAGQLELGESEKAPTLPQQTASIISRLRTGELTVDGLSEVDRGLVNKAIRTGGISLSVGPNGEMQFSQGGGGLSAPSVTKDEQAFITSQDTISVVNDLRDILSTTNVGAVGDFRKFIQGAVQQGGALAEALVGAGDTITEQAIQDGDDISSDRWFDPELSQRDYLANILAYKVAKTEAPGDRVTDRDLKNFKDSLGLGKALTGIKDIASILNAVERRTIRRANQANVRLKNKFAPLTTRAEQRKVATGGATPEDEANNFLSGN
ncbi:MAG: hypothetical protein V3R78_10205 [Thermodesulfobacteriota bacterium]